MFTEEIQLDDRIAPQELPPEIPEPTTEQETVSSASSTDIFTEEEFYEAFKASFYAAGMVTRIKALAIREEEEQGARITAYKIYHLGLSSPYFRWLIERSGWLKDAMAIGTFVYFKTDAVLQEKQGKSLKDIIARKVKAWRNRNKPTLKTRFASVFSVPPAPEKATGQES